MQVLESRFDLEERRVWFGKAKLMADRIVLKGWGYNRRIYLKDIVEVRWGGDELVIVLQDGEELDMRIRAAALWKYELQARCGLTDARSQESIMEPLRPGITSPSESRDEGLNTREAPRDRERSFLESASSYRIRPMTAEQEPPARDGMSSGGDGFSGTPD
jgi:hypothetical protein